ncbi:MAG: type II secretion system protein [Candidatus Moranbacteria bacterium]|nr:type II secretion system protein [Candidatus Moranbacteria bacterium]
MFLCHSNSIFSVRFRRGFTLLEVLLVIAMIVAVSFVGAPLFQSFQVRNDLALSASAASSMLRRAQVLSYSGANDESWGVSFQSGSIVLFQGSSYATRDASFDDVYDLSETIVPSGVSEIVFDRLSGRPQSTGTIILTIPSGENVSLSVNGWGAVLY